MNYREYLTKIGDVGGCTPVSAYTHSNPNWVNSYIGVPYSDILTFNGTLPLSVQVSNNAGTGLSVAQISPNQWEISGTPTGASLGFTISVLAGNCGETYDKDPQLIDTYNINELTPPDIAPAFIGTPPSIAPGAAYDGVIHIQNVATSDSFGTITWTITKPLNGTTTYSAIPPGVNITLDDATTTIFTTNNVIAAAGFLSFGYKYTNDNSIGTKIIEVNVYFPSGGEVKGENNSVSLDLEVAGGK